MFLNWFIYDLKMSFTLRYGKTNILRVIYFITPFKTTKLEKQFALFNALYNQLPI